jgi:hypothetical protein
VGVFTEFERAVVRERFRSVTAKQAGKKIIRSIQKSQTVSV